MKSIKNKIQVLKNLDGTFHPDLISSQNRYLQNDTYIYE
jgi:hypothetical protein